MTRWLLLLFWIVVCFAVGGVSGSWTANEIPTWYQTLTRPSFAPPNWVFAPVWSTLYLLMAVAAWKVSTSATGAVRGAALGTFAVQLALNFAWSLIFFRLHALGWARAEVLLMWAAIGATILLFSRASRTAAWLMAPYWAWVSFASVLNWGYWRLN